MYQKLSVKILFMVITAFVAWFAVILQFSISFPAYLAIGRTIGGIIVQLMSFFTILNNILVAVTLTILLLKPSNRLVAFFSSSSVQGAVAVYIAIVGIVYNIVLRGLLELDGSSMLADELLHVAVPVLYVLYWLKWSPKSELNWNDIYYWLIFPLIYLAFTIIRGAITGLYPYPFMDVTKLGYSTVAVNSLGMIVGFIVLSLLFIWLGRLMAKKTI